MTDARDDPDPATITTGDRLIELQHIDTDADQSTNRRERLDERGQLRTASTQLNEWERQRQQLRTRLDELSRVIEKAESDGAAAAAHRRRLEAQMKTVIAPREAEALMHEMSTIDVEIDELDMSELEALEAQSDIDDTLTSLVDSEGPLRDAVAAADAALEGATGAIDVELAELAVRREATRQALADQLLSRYDRVRAASGVAVTRLVGHRCDGCHLDLSAAEIDDVKEEAATSDGIAECPNCGRMLVL